MILDSFLNLRCCVWLGVLSSRQRAHEARGDRAASSTCTRSGRHRVPEFGKQPVDDLVEPAWTMYGEMLKPSVAPARTHRVSSSATWPGYPRTQSAPTFR